MKDDAAKLGIGSKFVFLGMSSILNLPVNIPSSRRIFINFCLVKVSAECLIEAATAELPVVATRCAGPIDIVKNGETGWLCEIDAIEAITHKTCELLQMKRCAKKDWVKLHGNMWMKYFPVMALWMI